MTHYEYRLEQDLQTIRTMVDRLGTGVEEALQRAVQSLLNQDRTRAYETILRDQILNRQVRDLDRACHSFVARHLPSAGHLRFISSVLRLTIALERIGDYAVTLCREAVQISGSLPGPVVRDLELFSGESQRALHQSLEAFGTLNHELAKGTHAMVAVAAAAYEKAFADLLEEGQAQSVGVRDLFSLLVVINRFGRVCDQAKNICEEAIFAATGQTKKPRHFRILFLEPEASYKALMAVAIGRKAYPEGATFSAGALQGEGLPDASMVEFMDLKGHELSGIPVSEVSDASSFSEFDLVIGLGDLDRRRLPSLPYHLVLLNWPVPGDPSSRQMDNLEEVYRDLAVRLRDLMEILRGSA
jgi:phosphate transport system protein